MVWAEAASLAVAMRQGESGNHAEAPEAAFPDPAGEGLAGWKTVLYALREPHLRSVCVLNGTSHQANWTGRSG
ncbi:hypothetical protein M2266_004006 [Streptomyces sp. SPB162]|nr:hypothetical protein [Streptomyces sp. SPB162]